MLSYLAAQPSDARILFLRADPLYYFLSGRRLPGAFDLVMPGIVGPGDDQRIAASLARVDQVIYNPKHMLTVPTPITEYAPETAQVLATDFRVANVLNPTAVVLKPRAGGRAREATVTDLWQDFNELPQFTVADQSTCRSRCGVLGVASLLYGLVALC